MVDYPYDPDVRARVARVLYEALPSMFRAQDRPPRGKSELERFLAVLAAPQAVLRQSIEELHADLFIGTANDWVIPYLAEMVGTTLVFPDADSNRRDIRGTIGWRRRKGTPQMLEEMGAELTNQLVVTQEGWKRLIVFQDLDLLRPERVVPDLRSPLIAEQSQGPLDATFHAVDVRSIGRRTGRYHPKHIVHWVHPTVTFPLRGSTCVEETGVGTDLRFSMHPLGERHPLRARRTGPDDSLATDSIPEQHFAADPGRWFGVDGRFAVRICGVLAGVAQPERPTRRTSSELASLEVARGSASLQLLEHDSRGIRGAVRIELGVAPASLLATGWQPDTASFSARATLDVDTNGVMATSSSGGPLPVDARVAMLRLTPLGGGGGRHLSGVTVVLAGGRPAAGAASQHAELAREGILEGALVVELPRLRVGAERWLLIAADGSIYDAEDGSGALLDHPRDGSWLTLGRAALLQGGPGSAWPPLRQSAEPRMLSRAPSAPGRGPVVLHGGQVLRRTATTFVETPPTTQCALVFALRVESVGAPVYHPFQALRWNGSDPSSATWTVLDTDGLPVGSDAAVARYQEVATLRSLSIESASVAVRFVCDDSDAVLAPAEVAWTADDGTVVLAHLPQSPVVPLPDGARWPVESSAYPFASEAIRIAEDGSTWAGDSTASRRRSTGSVAPLRSSTPSPLLRRRVRWRRLCAWDHDDPLASPPVMLPLTEALRLDVDVAHGLFAMARDEPPQAWPPDADGHAPPHVTVDMEDGATMHVGARPATREPVLDVALPVPTRIVSRSGHLHESVDASWHGIPRYRRLTDALDAINAEWQGLTPSDFEGFDELDEVELVEVVQFEDSATYPDEEIHWPGPPTNSAVAAKARLSLFIQAAESERPVVRLLAGNAPTYAADTEYRRLVLRGLAIGGVGGMDVPLPPTVDVAIELCTMLYGDDILQLADVADGSTIRFVRSELCAIVLLGPGTIEASDGIIEAAEGTPAIEAVDGEVVLDRMTVGGEVRVLGLEASEVIFDDRVEVVDRFRGCVRYSRVTGDSVLPRKHRVVVDTPVRYVSLNRHAPEWRRLREDCDDAVRRGAENGSEMGAFGIVRLAERTKAFGRRLVEYTPAGLVTGIIRVD